jgi:hypothetical protein
VSEGLPENGDVPKSSLTTGGRLDAVGRHKKPSEKVVSVRIAGAARSHSFTSARRRGARYEYFNTVKGGHDESTHHTSSNDHSTTVLGGWLISKQFNCSTKAA